MGSRTGLLLDYLSPAEFNAAQRAGVMGIAVFEPGVTRFDTRPERLTAPPPMVRVNTPVLGHSGALYEVWRTPRPVEAGARGRIQYTRTASMLFGCITVAEGAPAPAADIVIARHAPLYEATEQAYREIYDTLDTLGYPHLIRIWNYVPEINRDSHGIERYKQFNSARQAAMLRANRPVSGNVSAACALGAAPGSPLVIYFLASHSAATSIENPRQVSAYHYPPQYGPHSPVFARATVHREPDGLTLFISGTASIVGHQTLHEGDTAAQTRETLTNIEALLEETNRVTGSQQFTLDALTCKVYVRHPADLPVIEKELRSALGSACTRAVFLQADICRRDLAVEIEATVMVGPAAKGRTALRSSAAEHSF